MAFNSRRPSLSLRAIAGLFLAILAMQASAKVIRTPAKARRYPAKLVRDLKLKSSSVLIMDASDSSVLYSRHSDVPMPIASITKLMTALVVLDARQSLDEPIQITDADRDRPKGGFSRLAVGTVLTRGDLMHLALMSSENRAAHALGHNYPRGLPGMVAAMNAKAAALAMVRSRFVAPPALSTQNVASPEDLSKLVIA